MLRRFSSRCSYRTSLSISRIPLAEFPSSINPLAATPTRVIGFPEKYILSSRDTANCARISFITMYHTYSYVCSMPRSVFVCTQFLQLKDYPRVKQTRSPSSRRINERDETSIWDVGAFLREINPVKKMRQSFPFLDVRVI